MKKMFTQKNFTPKLAIVATLIAGILLTVNLSYGQSTYYSRFPNPAGEYQVTNPQNCLLAPAIQNAVGLADNDEDSYASFSGTLSTLPSCGNSRYTFDTYLNLPPDSAFLQAGNNAGWRVTVPTGTNIQELGANLTVTTFLQQGSAPSVLQESKSGSALLGVDVGQDGKGWFIYFTASKSFNILELSVNPAIFKLNLFYEFRVYNAFGGAVSTSLPATLANFKAIAAGKNVDLSWQSLTETNVSSYRIERSNGNGAYTKVANIAAKGNSNTAINYAYSDKALTDGNYLYRIVTVNVDGTTKATNSVSAAISGQGKLLLYPTIVRAGQDVTVKTSETGVVNVYLFDVTGRIVKQQRTTSSGQFTIPTTGLSKGVYNVKVVSASGAVLQSKIVVN